MGGFDIGALLQNPAVMTGLMGMLNNRRPQGGQQQLMQMLMKGGLFSNLNKQGMVPSMGPGEGTGFSPNRGWY